MKRLISLAALALLTLSFSQCSKPKLYGQLQENRPLVRYYSVSPEEAYRAAKNSLVYLGYSLKSDDSQNKCLETYWQPTTADSHYVEVFNRKDFGTVGAYYRLNVCVTERGSGSKVRVLNTAKSIISNLKSSRRQEGHFFHKVDDFTRSRDVQVTNIGLQ